MKVYFVGAGPGDPELLTVRALRLIRSARVCVYAGSLVDERILRELPKDCTCHDSAGMHLEEIVEIMRYACAQGRPVVRLHSGEPSLFGAIGEQMRRLDTLGIPYEVIPGISSFQAAAAALRVELTCPELSQTVVLTRAPGRTPIPAEESWYLQFHPRATYCLFLSAERFENIAPRIAERMGWDCPCAVVFHAARPDQLVIRSTLRDLPGKLVENRIVKTALIVIGYALHGANACSRLYDPDYIHGFRGASS